MAKTNLKFSFIVTIYSSSCFIDLIIFQHFPKYRRGLHGQGVMWPGAVMASRFEQENAL